MARPIQMIAGYAHLQAENADLLKQYRSYCFNTVLTCPLHRKMLWKSANIF